jgi:hypothetical protein
MFKTALKYIGMKDLGVRYWLCKGILFYINQLDIVCARIVLLFFCHREVCVCVIGGWRGSYKKDLAVYVWLQYLLGAWWPTADYVMQHQYKRIETFALEG